MRMFLALLLVALSAMPGSALDPYWPGLDSPKLITPQWVGEEGVEAVVVLSIDDMRDPARYEAFLRPILDRLRQIDGRAPVSISTLGVDPTSPLLQDLLKEGVSIESHTMDHPCPLLAGGDFEKCRTTVMMNIDLLCEIQNTKPVAFRMPCCDSMNSVSPRFYAEILHKTTPAGNFLQADSSVFNLFTPDDPALPKELIAPNGDEGGRFDKYIPRDRGFVNFIENYPYPYVIGGMSWQIPGTVPSDWAAQHKNGPFSPQTVADLKAAIDCTVIKQGVFTLVFHPHGWIQPAQVVELIDHTVAKHGKKVKFLSLREVVERLNENVLDGEPIRKAEFDHNWMTARAALRDRNRDGYFDIDIKGKQLARVWIPESKEWREEQVSLRNLSDDADQHMWMSINRPFRWVDVDGDGQADHIFSSAERYSVASGGRDRAAFSGVRGERDPQHEIPMIVRADGTNNGVWFRDGWMYIQNEDTGHLPGQVEKRKLSDFLKPLPAKDDLPNIPPKEPEEALQSMRTRPELSVELVAAEPLVMDPVDITWGPDGKLWVVEMADYPNGLDGKGKPCGRVRFLEDEDGDGRYEKSRLFLDELNFPTGVLPWRDGVLVTAAPEIIFAKDTNGDGAADERTVLYDGFREGNPQHRVNGLRWGLDNWIYIANGDSDGLIRSVKTGETVEISGRDLRIRPDDGLIDAQSGETQFGRCRDDWGNWFGCNNSYALWHFTLHDHYLRRNPHVASPAVTRMAPEEQGRLQLYPASTTVERFNDFHTANKITSACGIGIYRDKLLGDEFYGNAFICEPVHNLVTRQVVERSGLTFTSRRASGEESREFLASTDNWFRPVTATTGPDGALYVVDMYRHVIEHPEWIPGSWQKRLDLRAGENRGRIYRVVRRGKEARPVPDLAAMESPDLVDLLPEANGPLRDMVHMELLRRGAAEVSERLRATMRIAGAAAAVQILGILDGLGALTTEDVTSAMQNGSSAVRRAAVRLAENVEPSAELVTLLGELRNDPDPRVRHQVHLSLGNIKAPGVDELIVKALGELGAEEEDHELFKAGLLSSVTPELAARAILEVPGPGLEPVFRELVETAKAGGGGGALLDVAKRLAEEITKGDTLKVTQFDTAAALATGTPQAVQEALASMRERAEEVALDAESESAVRRAAVGFLGAAGGASATLATLVGRQGEAPEILAAAVRAFARSATKAEAFSLLDGWPGFSPTVRRAVIDSFLGRVSLAAALVERAREVPAIRRALTPGDLEHMRGIKLVKVREAAEDFAQEERTPALADQLAKFADAAALAIDVNRGRELFGTHCAVCHQVEGTGNEVGPDLAALTNRSFEALLTAIVDPNAAAEDKYLMYLVTTKDDEALAGCIASENATSLVVAQANGETRTVLRKDLKSLESTGRSLMTEGFGAALGPQEMADLIGYVQQMRPPAKEVAGNTPALVSADENGALTLTAANASIYGPRLTFGQQHKILEFWASEHDVAIWKVESPRAGTYLIELEFGCETGVENRFQLAAGDEKVTATVPQTKNWIDFQRREFGTIRLRQGVQDITVRSDGPVNKFLMDLRAVYLTLAE